MMSEPKTSNPLISFAEDSHVRTSACPVGVQESTESAADYGASLPESLASFDHDTQSWKTPQRSLLGGLDEFSETWPQSGMTRSGIAYRLEPLVPDISGVVHSWLPTPCATDWKGGTEAPRKDGADRGSELRHLLRALFGGTSPHPLFVEQVMGFPTGWTDLER